MNKRKWLVLFLTLAVVLAGIGAAAKLGRKHQEAIKGEEEPGKKIRVTALKVKEEDIKEQSFLAATVIPRERVKLASKIMAHVEKIYVKEGDRFEKGQLLVNLDRREITAHSAQASAGLEQALKAVRAAEAALEEIAAARKAAEATLANAQASYERTEKLFQAGVATQQDYDNATERLKAAKAQVERINAQEEAIRAQREQALAKVKEAQAGVEATGIQLSYTEILAPFDGYVVQKLVEEGDLVGPGQPVLVVDRPPWRVEAFLNEKYLQDIKVGDTLPVEIDTLGRKVVGRVAEINRAVDPTSRSFEVKIDLPEDAQVKPGMFVRVIMPAGNRKGIVLPEDALVAKYDLHAVYLVDAEGRARLRYVDVGGRVKDGVEILGGLNPGDVVVVKGVEGLSDGTPVEVEYGL